MTQHVLVIGGGQNAEHGISLKSAAAIGEALGSGGFEVSAVETAREKRCRLAGRGIAAP